MKIWSANPSNGGAILVTPSTVAGDYMISDLRELNTTSITAVTPETGTLILSLPIVAALRIRRRIEK